MPSASLTLLGGFDARLASGATLALPTHKYKALLAFLAVPAGQMHPRDRLVALLWGDRTHDQGRTALRQALWVLRKALNDGTSAGLVIDGDLIGVDPTAVAVDVADFERAASNGALADLERATALYRGEFLAGVAARETPFEEWLTVERERLRELALQAFARLLGHHRKTGALEAAAQTALRLLALDPLEESVHRVLMRTYVELGRRAAALRQYQACVSVLQREFGTEPDAETRALYRAIVSERVATAVKAPPHTVEAPPRVAVSPAPLVGRTLETTLLHEALEETIAGRGQVVVIAGEAGIGKSRLVEALSVDAEKADARVVIGHCFDTEQVLPYGPWTDALRRANLAGEGDGLEALPAMSRAALGRFVPELMPADFARDPAATDHMQVFDSVARLFELLAARRPLVLVIEDAHWADDISLRLLGFLAHRLHAVSRVLLAVTARSEEVADALQGLLDDLDRETAPLQISLAPLDRRETERLVATLGGGRNPAVLAQLNERIWTASQGSPFMVVETLYALRDDADADGQGELPLPERVRRVVARRIERVTAPARQLVATAAIIGRDFRFELLHRASGVGMNEAIEAVEELVRRHIFVEAGEGFDFSHARIREVARQALLAPRRRLLHQQVAEALEALHGDSSGRHAAVLGHHYREAEVWDRALSYLARAGADAHARGAVREAAIMMAQAVEALERLPAGAVTPGEALDLRLRAARPLYACGDMEGFAKTIGELQPLAERLGDRSRLGLVYAHQSEYLRAVHEYERAREAGEASLACAIDVGDEAVAAEANFQLGCLYSARGEERRALEYLEAATAQDPRIPSVGRIGILFPYLSALARRLAALAELGRFGEARQVAANALRLIDAGANPAVFPITLIGVVCVMQGHLDEAIARLVHARELQREHGYGLVRANATAFLAHAYALTGRRSEALSILEETADWDRAMPSPAQRGVILTHLGHAELLVGHVGEARRFAACALDFVMHHAVGGTEGKVRWLLGEIALSETTSAPDVAEAEFHQALTIAADRGLLPLAAHCRVGLARALHRRGKRDDARDQLASALATYRKIDMPFWADRAEAVL